MLTNTPTYTYCPYCTTRLQDLERSGRLRPTCPRCGFIQYRNPTMGVAVVLLRDDEILLGRRAASFSYGGQWCIPCGHVEWDEDVREAAMREFAEETGLAVQIADGMDGIVAVHSNFHKPAQPTVGIWFRGTVVGGAMGARDDLDLVQYFPLATPPESLAFPNDRVVLQQLLQEYSLRA